MVTSGKAVRSTLPSRSCGVTSAGQRGGFGEHLGRKDVREARGVGGGEGFEAGGAGLTHHGLDLAEIARANRQAEAHGLAVAGQGAARHLDGHREVVPERLDLGGVAAGAVDADGDGAAPLQDLDELAGAAPAAPGHHLAGHQIPVGGLPRLAGRQVEILLIARERQHEAKARRLDAQDAHHPPGAAASGAAGLRLEAGEQRLRRRDRLGNGGFGLDRSATRQAEALGLLLDLAVSHQVAQRALDVGARGRVQAGAEEITWMPTALPRASRSTARINSSVALGMAAS